MLCLLKSLGMYKYGNTDFIKWQWCHGFNIPVCVCVCARNWFNPLKPQTPPFKSLGSVFFFKYIYIYIEKNIIHEG